MLLSELKENQEAIIRKVNCSNELKQRFYSFGIIKGASVKMENFSLAKNTLEINIEDTLIGIRVEEANSIEIEII